MTTKRHSRSILPAGAQDHPHPSLLHAPSASDGTPLGRYETFRRVKANRQVCILNTQPAKKNQFIYRQL